MKKVYNLIIDGDPLIEARKQGAQMRRWRENSATNPYEEESEESLEWRIGYYSYDHVDFKKKLV